jgi:hypothetical protein
MNTRKFILKDSYPYYEFSSLQAVGARGNTLFKASIYYLTVAVFPKPQ